MFPAEAWMPPDLNCRCSSAARKQRGAAMHGFRTGFGEGDVAAMGGAYDQKALVVTVHTAAAGL